MTFLTFSFILHFFFITLLSNTYDGFSLLNFSISNMILDSFSLFDVLLTQYCFFILSYITLLHLSSVGNVYVAGLSTLIVS